MPWEGKSRIEEIVKGKSANPSPSPSFLSWTRAFLKFSVPLAFFALNILYVTIPYICRAVIMLVREKEEIIT